MVWTVEPLREGTKTNLNHRPPTPRPAAPRSQRVTDSNVEHLPTDAAIAAEVRATLPPVLEQVAAIMNKARAHGLIVNFNVGLDQYGLHRPSPIDVTKPL